MSDQTDFKSKSAVYKESNGSDRAEFGVSKGELKKIAKTLNENEDDVLSLVKSYSNHKTSKK